MIRRLQNVGSVTSTLSALAAATQKEFDHIYKNLSTSEYSVDESVGLRLSGREISADIASASKTGVLLAADWSRFNEAYFAVITSGNVTASDRSRWDYAYDVAVGGGGSPLTTKGDIYTFSTVGTRLPVGTDGYVLVADSSTSTGLKWDTGPAGSGISTLNTLTAATQTFAKVDDTNVTLAIGSASSTHTFTLGWTGTLAAGRLNSNVVQAITNDTNVTGSITAQNLTLGWTGTLADGRIASAATWNAKVAATRSINTTSPLTGGGDLSADRTLGLAGLTGVGAANQLPGTNAGATGWEYKTLSVGTAGTDFAIAHAANSIAFNLPTASSSNRGALSSADWSTFNNKQAALSFANLSGTTNQVNLSASGTGVLVGSTSITLSLPQNIHTSATPQFARVGLGAAAHSSILLNLVGPEPSSNCQFRITSTAGAPGVYSVAMTLANSVYTLFDCDYLSDVLTARHASLAYIGKDTGALVIGGSTGNTVGAAGTMNTHIKINLADGYVNIGSATPFPAMLSVGTSQQFQVNSTGNILKINNVTTSWPGTQGGANTYLKNDGSGNLSWATAGGGTPADFTAGASLSITAGTGVGALNQAMTLNTIQDIRTTATPQFTRIGIGAVADATALGLFQNNANSNTQLIVKNTTAGTASQASLNLVSDTAVNSTLGVYSSSTTPFGAVTSNCFYMYTDNTAGIALMVNASGSMRFATGGSAARVTILSNGNVEFTGLITRYNNVTPTTRKVLIGNGASFVESTPTVPFDTAPIADIPLIGNATNFVTSWGTGHGSITSASGAIANSETKLLSSDTVMAANRLLQGSVIRIIVHGTCTSTNASGGTFRVRYGTNGTTADGLLQTFAMGAGSTSGTAVPFFIQIIITIRSTGASATSDGVLCLVNQGTTGISGAQTQVVRGSATNINTGTANTYLTLTYQSGHANISSTFQDVVMRIDYK